MKRHGLLWPKLVSFENLYLAYRKARRGKRNSRAATRFEHHLERELSELRLDLITQTYRPGPYRTFTIHDGKPRLISAAPFRDRVVHHALCNVVEPLFERCFIHDSYACRPGKGTHAAVDRYQQFSRRFRYVLKCDIRKFFPSIDHAILKQLVARKIKDRDLLRLVEGIIDGSNEQIPVEAFFPGDELGEPQEPTFRPVGWTPRPSGIVFHGEDCREGKRKGKARTDVASILRPEFHLPLTSPSASERRRGLPIGNQTSQFFGNVMLNPLDHFVQDELRCPAYVRYCDDFLLLSNDKTELAEWRRRIEQFLCSLRLRLHPTKRQISRTADGLPFLGYRVWPQHRRLTVTGVRRFRRNLKRYQAWFRAGRIDSKNLTQRLRAWLGHARHADTEGLRRWLFASTIFTGPRAKEPCPAGRVVEQRTTQHPLGQP